MNMMEYKGYLGSIDYTEEDGVLFGKIEFIRALVSYEAEDVKGVHKAFEEAVDDYLDLCKRKGIEVEKPFKGSFNVRIDPNLHRDAAHVAKRRGISLNSLVADALKQAVHSNV